MRRFFRVFVLACLALGCSRWVRLSEGPPIQAVESRPYQIWIGDSVHVLRALQVDGDTLRGVVTRPGYCANCMVGFGLAGIDSIRVNRSTGGGEAFLTGFGMGAIGVWAYLLSGGFGLW